MGGSRSDHKLFVEGTDDRHVIVSLIRALRPELKSVWDKGFDIAGRSKHSSSRSCPPRMRHGRTPVR